MAGAMALMANTSASSGVLTSCSRMVPVVPIVRGPVARGVAHALDSTRVHGHEAMNEEKHNRDTEGFEITIVLLLWDHSQTIA